MLTLRERIGAVLVGVLIGVVYVAMIVLLGMIIAGYEVGL